MRLFFLSLLLLGGHLRAQLAIEIIGVGANQLPIAIVPFAGEMAFPLGITGIIENDLKRSGLFKSIEVKGAPRPSRPEEVLAADWVRRGAETAVVGSMSPAANGKVDVRFYLVDVVKQQQLLGFAYSVSTQEFRALAHRIADLIYEKLTGDKGVFASKIAYISKAGRTYRLHVADADGDNAQTVLTSSDPLISPVWSPNGNELAFVSFETQKPVIYIQNLATGQKRTLTHFRGSSSAPAWSPDGRRLVFASSMDGPTQLYLIQADGTGLRRLSSSGAIDTNPAFMPDGNSLLFTSDRGGSPQIYRLSLHNNAVERLSFDGAYNAAAKPSPDGKSFVYIRREGSREMIAIQDFATRQTQVLTQGPVDESPSFAPNGKMIVYASAGAGRGILSAVSSDGRIKQNLSSPGVNIREPAWGPMTQ
ncbi:MAG: protein TolB [Pseudomonadota bacterium]